MIPLGTVSVDTAIAAGTAWLVRWRTGVFAAEVPPDRAALQRLVDDAGAPWQLVDPRAARTVYEQAIAQGRIPTREGSWHDAFNVLAFLAWPRAKLALHARVLRCQAERSAVGRQQRGREEDALALVDETLLVVSGASDAIGAFEAARWEGSIDRMDEAVAAGLRVRWFGHALLEHLALGRPPVSAGAWTIVLGPGESDDEVLARQIESGHFTRPCFSPGIPWPDRTVLGWVER